MICMSAESVPVILIPTTLTIVCCLHYTSGVAAHQPGALDQPQFGVGFESVGGLSEVKRSLREMVLLPLCYPQLLHDMGITAPRYDCMTSPSNVVMHDLCAGMTAEHFQG